MASDDIEDGFNLKKLKIFKKFKWQYLILIAIIILGIYLRSYHINYPTIGYHNMKEDHYLSLALNMKDTGNYLRTTWFDCNGNFVNDYFGDPYKKCNGNWGEHPVAVWTLMLSLFLSGWQLWGPRLVIILFAAFSIIPIYLIMKRLSNNEYLAILTSLIYVVLPITIFFGRNIQMDAPSYFFSLLTLYFFMKFVEDNKTKDFIIGCVFFVLAGWFKPLSLLVVFPIIFIIPFERYKKYVLHIKEYKIEIVALIAAIILYAIWPVYLSGAVMPDAKAAGAIGSSGWIDTTFAVFTSGYWSANKPIIFSYIADNFSWLGFWLMIAGFALFLMKYKSKISRFMAGYALGIIIYIIFFAYKWNGHAYYQYPFVLFVAACIANVFFQAGMILKSFFSNHTVKSIIQFLPLIALILLIAPFKASTARVFDTQFYGQDVAGLYINEHTSPNEIFLLEKGGQNQVSWTARRFYYTVPDDVEILKRVENEKGLKYIVATYSGVGTIQQKKSWQYITENYHIVQAGFIQTPQGPQVYHMILEKGGIFNMTELGNKPARLVETYETTYSEVPYYVIE
ncbi:MAG: glycosyltransferase family 39 protein [Candidatus Woesearchaeota archaeon]